MKDSEKSREIVNKNFEWISYFVEENNLSKEDRNQIRFKIYSACQEMADWKEQQMMKKACEWLEDNLQGGVHSSSIYRFIKDFKQAMEE